MSYNHVRVTEIQQTQARTLHSNTVSCQEQSRALASPASNVYYFVKMKTDRDEIDFLSLQSNFRTFSTKLVIL